MTEKEFNKVVPEAFLIGRLRKLYYHYEIESLNEDNEPYPYAMWINDILEHIEDALAL